MTDTYIPFNKPFIAGRELFYIAQAVMNGHTAGDGPFTKKCHEWMEERFSAKKVLLTHSCTAALEMAAILCDVGPGDEVIMPSFTFVSTSNAFYLRGAKPVFVDIRPDTLNIDETKIEAAITPKTKAIVPMHYAGVAAEMDTIMALASKYGLWVVEDAAQGVNATYKGQYLGTIGHIGTYSFHETKNVISGEGGAILLNDDRFIKRAEIIREKGTNRSQFFRGEVDKYTWVDVGSSYLPSDLIAAFLYAQLEEMDVITEKRWRIFDQYWNGLTDLAKKDLVRLPITPESCRHNAHLFHLLVIDPQYSRDDLIAYLKSNAIHSVFHYIPLHTSPVGKALGYHPGDFPVTEVLSEQLVRLPCYFELESAEQNRIIRKIFEYFGNVE